jgi:hypothetical protein
VSDVKPVMSAKRMVARRRSVSSRRRDVCSRSRSARSAGSKCVPLMMRAGRPPARARIICSGVVRHALVGHRVDEPGALFGRERPERDLVVRGRREHSRATSGRRRRVGTNRQHEQHGLLPQPADDRREEIEGLRIGVVELLQDDHETVQRPGAQCLDDMVGDDGRCRRCMFRLRVTCEEQLLEETSAAGPRADARSGMDERRLLGGWERLRLRHEAGLAHALLADDEHDAPASRGEVVEMLREKAQLRHTADERKARDAPRPVRFPSDAHASRRARRCSPRPSCP